MSELLETRLAESRQGAERGQANIERLRLAQIVDVVTQTAVLERGIRIDVDVPQSIELDVDVPKVTPALTT
jgi:hypothetical protein